MSEKLPLEQQERINDGELRRISHERVEEIRQERERSAERSIEDSPEKAAEAVKDAIHEREKREAVKTQELLEKQPPVERRNTKQSRKASYNAQMKQVRSELPPISRTFSKIIHAKTIEKTSEAIGNTIARPNAILSGSVSALIFTGGLYFWARYNGYPLSGFETIGAFIVGWLIGIIFDFSRIMVTGKR